MKDLGGRPLKFKSAKELEEKINKYFDECDKKDEPYTITGLALALDVDRKTILNYQNKEQFFPTIKKAKLRIENYLEKHLITENSVTGIIFNLKNNYNWKDKQEIESKINLTYEDKLREMTGKDEY